MEFLSLAAKPLFKAGAELAEGPLWDGRIQRLWWVDITASKLHRLDPLALQDECFDVGSHIGAVVPEEGREVLLALKDGFARFEGGKVTMLSSMQAGSQETRFNDGKCDPAGRFWAGTLAYGFLPGAGNLVCLERDLSISRKIKGVTISNGLAWSPSGAEMYYIDSPSQRVLAFSFEASSGALGAPRLALSIDASEGTPDGMTVDSEGMLWIALYNGSKVIRANPASGERLGEIAVPAARQVTSCTFGGDDLRTLFITTGAENLSPEERQLQPEAGSLFFAEPGQGIHGLAAHSFKAL